MIERKMWLRKKSMRKISLQKCLVYVPKNAYRVKSTGSWIWLKLPDSQSKTIVLFIWKNCYWIIWYPNKQTKWSRSVVSDSVTPWTVVYQASLSTGFSRQEYWSGFPFPSPGDLLSPGTRNWASHIVGRRFTVWATTEVYSRSLFIKLLVSI